MEGFRLKFYWNFFLFLLIVLVPLSMSFFCLFETDCEIKTKWLSLLLLLKNFRKIPMHSPQNHKSNWKFAPHLSFWTIFNRVSVSETEKLKNWNQFLKWFYFVFSFVCFNLMGEFLRWLHFSYLAFNLFR